MQNGEREPTVLYGLEKFKKLVPKGIPAVTVTVVFLATLVAAIILLVKQESKKATKFVEKTEKNIRESKTIPPLAKTVLQVPLVVAKRVTSTITSYPWIPLVVAVVGVVSLIKYGRSTRRSGEGGEP